MMRNIARGWERLLERAGWRRGGERPASRNVLHTSRNVLRAAGDAASALRDGVPAAADPLPAAPDALPAAVAGGALRAEPTRVRPCEDPSCRESLLTPNQRAYAEDAKRFRSA